MPDRIDKLLKVLASSNIPEKNILRLAILKRRPDATEERLKVMEKVLSYDKGTAFKQEKKEFRLYSRLALTLAGVVRSPTFSTQELEKLKSQFDAKYGDAGYAKGEFGKLKTCAWSIQKYKLCAITPEVFDGALRRAHMDWDTVERVSTDSIRIARDTLQHASDSLRGQDKEALAHYERWFGKYDQRLYTRVRDGVGVMSDALENHSITLDWDGDDVWGTAVGNGMASRKPLKLGWKFFSDNHSCLYSTDKAVIANWAATEKAYAEKEKLAANSRAADGPVETITSKVREFKKRNPGAELSAALAEQEKSVAAGKARAAENYNQFMQQRSKKIARYGTLIHELSHWALGTTDVKYNLLGSQSQDCYGAGLSARLAELDSALATTNADNYRIFCELYGP